MAYGDGPADAALKAAWHAFCDKLKDAGDKVFKDANPTAPIMPPLYAVSEMQRVSGRDLLDAFANDARLMPHLHLSLQHGDDLILKRMKRRHSRADAISFCDQVRRLRPDVVFGGDIIAGFPTETEDAFARSLDLVDECGLTHLHVFPFSARPGTPAARMPQVAGEVVKDRARRLRQHGAAALAQKLHRGLIAFFLGEAAKAHLRPALQQRDEPHTFHRLVGVPERRVKYAALAVVDRHQHGLVSLRARRKCRGQHPQVHRRAAEAVVEFVLDVQPRRRHALRDRVLLVHEADRDRLLRAVAVRLEADVVEPQRALGGRRQVGHGAATPRQRRCPSASRGA